METDEPGLDDMVLSLLEQADVNTDKDMERRFQQYLLADEWEDDVFMRPPDMFLQVKWFS